METDAGLIEQSFVDLQEDFEELLYLASDLADKIHYFQKQLKKNKTHITPFTQTLPWEITGEYLEKVNLLIHTLEVLEKQLQNSPTNPVTLLSFTDQKRRCFGQIRTLYSLIGGLITMTDWQSPTYETTKYSMAGRLTGRIHATTNDYKRDQHEDEFFYEDKFIKEYVDSAFKFPLHVDATHSGMAAFSTIINFLNAEGKIKNPVLVGSSTYFESKDLLKLLFRDTYQEMDDSNTDGVIESIKKYRPSAIFLDTIGNTPSMYRPDITKIIHEAQKILGSRVYIVLDNTAAGITYQPIGKYTIQNLTCNLIVYESLNKFYQFGMDRTLGGIIWSYGRDTAKIFDYRVHSGTNISDNAVLTLPTPNRQILEKRMRKLGRNTLYLALEIQKSITSNPKSPIASVIYPGLPNHPCYPWTGKRDFNGAFFMLDFKAKYQSVKFYQKTIQKIMQKAKDAGVELVGGTSFGMPVTRIYLTAIRSTTTVPFIRVSPGTENIYDLSRLKEIFINSLQ